MEEYKLTHEEICKIFPDYIGTYNERTFAWNKIKNRLKDKNILIDMFQYLGEGSKGKVFQINSDTVLKVTDDNTEVDAGYIIMNNPTEDIVNIKDLFGIWVTSSYYRYIIIEEKLETPSTEWMKFADDYDGDTTLKHYKKYVKKISSKEKEQDKHKLLWLKRVCEYMDKFGIVFGDIHYKNIMRREKHPVLIDVGYITGVNKQPYEWIE